MVGEPLDNSQMDTIIIKRESTLNIERSKFQREMQRLFQTTKCKCCKLKPQRSCFTQDCSLFRQETPILFLNIKTKIPISPLTLVWLNKIIPLIVRNFILNSFLQLSAMESTYTVISKCINLFHCSCNATKRSLPNWQWLRSFILTEYFNLMTRSMDAQS